MARKCVELCKIKDSRKIALTIKCVDNYYIMIPKRFHIYSAMFLYSILDITIFYSKHYFLRMAMSIILSTKIVMYVLKHNRV